MKEVQGYEGYPSKRSNISFLILFEDDTLPIWLPYSKDLAINSLVQTFMKKTAALEHLFKDSIESDKYIKEMQKTKLNIQLGDEIYIDIRVYSDEWHERLSLPDAFTKRHIVQTG